MSRTKRLRESLASAFPEVVLTTENKKAAESDLVFLALHPPAMKEGVRGVRNALRSGSIVVSLSPKHSLAGLSLLLGGFDRVARMIPNAPSIIGKGYNPVCFSTTLSAEDLSDLDAFFSAFGTSPHVKEENLEAFAVLTAMGTTYFLFQIRKIMTLASGFGLQEADVREGMQSMLEGMVWAAFRSGLSMDEVIDLIPGKPMAPYEDAIEHMYESSLNGIYAKLKA